MKVPHFSPRNSGHGVLAVALALGVSFVAFFYGAKVAGGSDSWGYLSQADYWAEGRLPFMDLSFVRGAPLPVPTQLFSPLAWNADRHWSVLRAAPVTAPGYPLLVAAAKVIAGDAQKFWVVPLFAGLLVIATFGIGKRMVSPEAGLIAAWLTATSPTVLYMSMSSMSDIPVAGAWAAAIFLLLGQSRASGLGAGLMTGLAVMIRPNHLPLAAVLGLRYLVPVLSATVVPTLRKKPGVGEGNGSETPGFLSGVLYSAGALVGILATAAINDALYRSPFRSGYGDLGRLFSIDYVIPNATNYISWLIESQTPLALAGVAALLVPIRALWPALQTRLIVVVGALFVASLWSIYLFYEVFDAWWYLRFVLGSWPFIMVGTAAVLAWLMRRTGRVGTAVIAVSLAAMGVHEVMYAERRQTFDLWRGERRYIRSGQMVGKLTEPNSVILSGQLSGTVRYYGGRVTMRLDRTAGNEVDDIARWLKSRGAHLYVAVEEWELPDIERRWRGSEALVAMKQPPIGIYRQGNDVRLYAITEPRDGSAKPEIESGVDEGLYVPGAAPEPWLFFSR